MATDNKPHVTTKKGNKKKSGGSKKSQRSSWQQEQNQYYHRLLHSAQKSLHKQAKTVRNFECQKWIRKIKEAKRDASALETSYQEMKQLDLELVVQECLRRLGILHLDPKGKVNNDEDNDNSDDKEEEVATTNQSTPPLVVELVEKLLKHKRMQSALEEWNEQVTEYRRWCLQKQEREDQPRFASGSNTTTATSSSSAKKKKAKKKKKDDDEVQVLTDTTDQSLFVQLGAAAGRQDDDDEDNSDNGDQDNDPYQNPYGPGTFLADEDQQPKKNRKGQRARRAKAMAIEAKKAGRLHRASDSVNWRQPKDRSQQQQQQQQDNHHHQNNNNKAASSQSHHQQQQQQPPLEELHPSWAAAKKKDSIVKFEGTKITF